MTVAGISTNSSPGLPMASSSGIPPGPSRQASRRVAPAGRAVVVSLRLAGVHRVSTGAPGMTCWVLRSKFTSNNVSTRSGVVPQSDSQCLGLSEQRATEIHPEALRMCAGERGLLARSVRHPAGYTHRGTRENGPLPKRASPTPRQDAGEDGLEARAPPRQSFCLLTSALYLGKTG